jgi:signal transduction histidine kinase
MRERLTQGDPRRVADSRRIAGELHDNVIQRLFAAGLSLQSVAASVDEDVAVRLENVIDQIDETIAEVRATIRVLAGGSRP